MTYNDITAVGAVLLADGAWHDVEPGTLSIVEHQFVKGGITAFNGGHSPGVAAVAFTFETPDGAGMYGPLASILATKTAAPAATGKPA